MSNYANINSSFRLSNHTNENYNIKNKFITSNDTSILSHGYYIRDDTKSIVIDDETLLLKKSYNKKEKEQLKLFCEKNKDIGAGRGFGNLIVSNDIRKGDASRYDTKEFKEIKEGEQFFDYKFQYLDRNFQDPSNIVMQFPRGGESTRKQNQLTVNTMRNDTSDFTVNFNY
jgi:hypothetical protein